MSKKAVGFVIIILLVIFGIFLLYAEDNPSNDVNKTTLNVSSEGPIKLSKLIDEIKTKEYYEGYDKETISWMESLGDKYVWFSSDEIVIMNKWDSDKIPSIYACDAFFNEIFSCNVLENHSLGNIKYPRDVLLVENVEYITEEIGYVEV